MTTWRCLLQAGIGRGVANSRSFTESELVIAQANTTTLMELRGISTAQITGDIWPRAAMPMPTTL